MIAVSNKNTQQTTIEDCYWGSEEARAYMKKLFKAISKEDNNKEKEKIMPGDFVRYLAFDTSSCEWLSSFYLPFQDRNGEDLPTISIDHELAIELINACVKNQRLKREVEDLIEQLRKSQLEKT